jgi:3-oxoacyl-[acyl-carrier-protein] synthase-3
LHLDKRRAGSEYSRASGAYFSLTHSTTGNAMSAEVGIIAAACYLPSRRQSTGDLFELEGIPLTSQAATQIGIDQVPAADKERGSAMALAASQEALRRAGIQAAQLDVIVDYTILPQDYLVPAWNMSNQLQHELGASKAFTVGFSGGGASNFLVALASATALLQTNEKLQTALLVASDVTIPGNRVLNPADPVSVLGDAASAVVLRRDAAANVVVDTELWSVGDRHDLYYIPGGALAHPDDPKLYRVQLDKQRYDAVAKAVELHRLIDTLLERAGIRLSDVAFALYPNISRQDQMEFQEALGLKAEQMCLSTLAAHGHLQGTDFVVNYLAMLECGAVHSGEYFLAASHGMGFLAGVSLFRA